MQYLKEILVQEAIFEICRIEDKVSDLSDVDMKQELSATQHSSDGKAEVQALTTDFLVDKIVAKRLDVRKHRDKLIVVSTVIEQRVAVQRKLGLPVDPKPDDLIKKADNEEEVVTLNDKGRPQRKAKS